MWKPSSSLIEPRVNVHNTKFKRSWIYWIKDKTTQNSVCTLLVLNPVRSIFIYIMLIHMLWLFPFHLMFLTIYLELLTLHYKYYLSNAAPVLTRANTQTLANFKNCWQRSEVYYVRDVKDSCNASQLHAKFCLPQFVALLEVLIPIQLQYYNVRQATHGPGWQAAHD